MEPWLNKEKVKVVDFYRGEVFNLSVPGVHNEFNARGQPLPVEKN